MNREHRIVEISSCGDAYPVFHDLDAPPKEPPPPEPTALEKALALLRDWTSEPTTHEYATLTALEALAAETAALRARLDAIEHARQQEAYAAMGDDL